MSTGGALTSVNGLGNKIAIISDICLLYKYLFLTIVLRKISPPRQIYVELLSTDIYNSRYQKRGLDGNQAKILSNRAKSASVRFVAAKDLCKPVMAILQDHFEVPSIVTCLACSRLSM